MPKREQAQGSHHRPRTRPVRRRIAWLLAVPLTSLVVVWAFAAGGALTAALQRFDFSTLYEQAGQPANGVVRAVQEERAFAAAALGGHESAAVQQRFREQAARTDAVVAAFRRSVSSPDVQDALSTQRADRLRAVGRSFDDLPTLRSRTRAGTITPLQVIDGYSRITDTTIQFLGTSVSVDDIAVYQNTNALLNAFWARDFMLREDALVSSLPASGKMTAAQRIAFAGWAANQAQFLTIARNGLMDELVGVLQPLADSPEYAAFRSREQAVLTRGAVRKSEWRTAVDRVSPLWLRVTHQAGTVLNDRQVEPAGRAIMVRFVLVGGVGLLTVALSIVLSLLFARRISAELRSLQHAARELAHERLPRVVARLRRGEEVDVEAEAPRPEIGRTQEIAVVADAFAAVRRTAVATAVGEAELRANINKVFVNLSWRSQSLLHRQLSLLDTMERRAASPEELEALFQLDHLTTRMRRHAEGLVILSGAPTMRAWDHPVPAEDLLRAAIAEVEDYTRIEVTGASAAAVTGTVVADVIHLLAELIENAAAFSPPTTEVTVRAESVANGLAIDVVDRGLGLDPEELAELSGRLADGGDFDLADTDRLGLFVVARLASRHGIKVSLQTSAYGGTSAVVLIPHELVTDDTGHGTSADGQGSPRQLASPNVLGRSTAPSTAAIGAQSDPTVTAQDQPAADPPSARPVPSAPDGRWPAPGPPPGGTATDDESHDPFGPEFSETTGRLPQRVRQRNLAPQLRRAPGPGPGDAAGGRPAGAWGAADEEPDDPSPEVSRDLMSALQAGWTRGRRDHDESTHPDAHDDWSAP